jgi:hypothetical protein
VWVIVCGGDLKIAGVFSNMCTFIYCVVYYLHCVIVLFRLCIFILRFVCTSVRTTAAESKLTFSK